MRSVSVVAILVVAHDVLAVIFVGSVLRDVNVAHASIFHDTSSPKRSVFDVVAARSLHAPILLNVTVNLAPSKILAPQIVSS